jgi:serine/threonine-protein kinase
VVPGYRVERLLGEGGFGQVWYALDPAGGPVAIKLLHLDLIQSADALTRFARELEAISRLVHPNVVRPLSRGTLDDGRPFLVLEYIEGQNLRDQIAERGVIRPTDMLEILEPLCEALTAAHAVGLVHRDIKASNVIVARTGAALRPVLLDFGLVKLLDEQGPGLTSSRNMLGTPVAMAPEQLRGQSVDARTDVYALGLLVYTMLTGQPAYGGMPGIVQNYLQVHGPRPRPSSKVDIDPALDAPVARALSPDPKDRFASARDLAAAFRAVLHPAQAVGAEQAVIALCVEGAADVVARAWPIARDAGMTAAIQAPDSLVCVAPSGAIDVGALAAELGEVAAAGASVAIGTTTATIGAASVDGAALDVESWAPYPLPVGLWLADELRSRGKPE